MPTTSVRHSKLTPKKFLASVYWDSKGLLLFEVLPKNVSLTSDIYCQQLGRLEHAIREKKTSILQKQLLHARQGPPSHCV